LLFIFLVFFGLEFYDWTRISYSESTVGYSSSNLNKSVFVGKALSSEPRYLMTELSDLHEILKVSRKLTVIDEVEESRIEDLNVKTRTRSGKRSSYVKALQSTNYQRRFPDRSRGFFPFNLRDSASGNLICFSIMLEAHVARLRQGSFAFT